MVVLRARHREIAWTRVNTPYLRTNVSAAKQKMCSFTKPGISSGLEVRLKGYSGYRDILYLCVRPTVRVQLPLYPKLLAKRQDFSPSLIPKGYRMRRQRTEGCSNKALVRSFVRSFVLPLLRWDLGLKSSPEFACTKLSIDVDDIKRKCQLGSKRRGD